MSLLTATQITAVATAVLAAGAIVTAVFAYLAFGKQSQEVRTLDREARDQAKLLEIQSSRLDAQREQLTDQQTLNKQQTEVLALQAKELAESMAQRKREADDRHRAQAARVFITKTRTLGARPSGIRR
jgi:TATA-binding protein-associated factor Taf7